MSVDWRREADVSTPPVVDENRIYTAGGTAFRRDGRVDWTRDGSGSLALGEEYLYAGGDPIRVLDPEDGAALGEIVTGGSVINRSGPVVADGTVYHYADRFPEERDARRIVLAATSPDDDTDWEFTLAEIPDRTREPQFRFGPPVVNEDAVYVIGQREEAQDDGPSVTTVTLHAVSRSDGTERWSREIDGEQPGQSSVVDGALYVSIRQETGDELTRELKALDAGDGAEKWAFGEEVDGLSPVAVADGRAFVATVTVPDEPESADEPAPDPERSVRALSADDGSQAWERGIDMRVSGDANAPVVAGDTVYLAGGDGTFGRRGRILALATGDGSRRWRAETDDAFVTHPVVVGGRIYAGTRNGLLYALS